MEFCKCGADLNRTTEEGVYGYPLIAALARESLVHDKSEYNSWEEEKKLDFIRKLLRMGADPNVCFGNRTPLITAMEKVRNYDTDIVTLLLDSGADPNAVVPWYGEFVDEGDTTLSQKMLSPLHAAAMRGKHAVVNILLEKGGDPRLLPDGYRVRKQEEIPQ